MPITTSTVKTVITEKKISKINIDDDNKTIHLELVMFTKYDTGEIISEKRKHIFLQENDMLDLCGINPPLQVPTDKNYYEAVRDRCYEFINERNLWENWN